MGHQISPAVRDGVLSYFHFWPSRDVAIVALSLFLATSLALLFVTIRTRTWYMLVAVGVGLAEVGGFASRIQMFSKPTYGCYVAMQCLLIIPPSFLALVQYLTLGKVVNAIQRRVPNIRLPIRGSVIGWSYFAAELASLALQGAGAGLSVSNNSTPANASAGRAMLMIGLALLVAIMAVYIINAIWVHASPIFGIRRSRNLTAIFCVLYTSTLLLLARNIFRLIEFAGGFYGSLARNEALFYTLDSLLVLLILLLSTVAHYGHFLNAFAREEPVTPAQPTAAQPAGPKRDVQMMV